jgi:hypothetical protein
MDAARSHLFRLFHHQRKGKDRPGLSTVLQDHQAEQGNIWAYSEVGRGRLSKFISRAPKGRGYKPKEIACDYQKDGTVLWSKTKMPFGP